MDTPIDPLFDNHERAASFVAKMYSASNSTLRDVQKGVLCTQELMENTLNYFKCKTTSLLNEYSISVVLKLFRLGTPQIILFEVGTPLFVRLDSTGKYCKNS